MKRFNKILYIPGIGLIMGLLAFIPYARPGQEDEGEKGSGTEYQSSINKHADNNG